MTNDLATVDNESKAILQNKEVRSLPSTIKYSCHPPSYVQFACTAAASPTII